ncbi:hypothetical protein [Kitasatospora sp. NPDC059571]|uniref:hypothetical protein n=1 Tax=Kitasatospora sp. NPDC059571 TaxID=3346871 RepID=UPI003679148A
MSILRRALAATLAALAAFLVLLSAPAAPAAAAAGPVPTPVTITGVDLHDGTIVKDGDTYYLYGTAYGCGFTWRTASPWCGFGVSTATSLTGPWSSPTLLFSPQDIDPWTGTSWASECGSTGEGCFNARMIQRTGWGYDDGVWILWFNSPADYSRSHANAYNAMGCAGPAGPCGPNAGVHGSYTKPALWVCAANGDFSLITIPGQAPAIVCSMPGTASLSVEQLAGNGVNGTGTGSRNLAGLATIEAPGMWQDAASGTWVMTYSDPSCGYCAGTPTGYATAASPYGPWTAPANAAAAGPVVYGRRDISPSSCGGQPRTVTVLDGQPYQLIDLWKGTPNETGASVRLEPLTYRPAVGATGDGGLWQPALAPFTCN